MTESNKYVLYLNGVNMRKGIEGLCGMVRHLSLLPTNGDVYVFLNKSRTILKLLHWERGGYVIYHKRLEKGRISHKVFLRQGVGFSSIRWDELVLLMEGISPATQRRIRYNLDEKRE